MKKLLAVLIAVCVLGIAAVTYFSMKPDTVKAETTEAAETMPETAAAEESTESTESAEITTDVVSEDTSDDTTTVKYLDYEALYSAYSPETVVAEIGDREITWEEFYPWITYFSENLEYYMQMYAYYGYSLSWYDVYDEETGETYLDRAVESALTYVEQVYNTLDYAEENGILTEEMETEADAELEDDMVTNCGEDATLEEYKEYLLENQTSYEQQRNIALFNLISEAINTQMFGENYELVSDEDALAYLNSNGYIYANHILIMTQDAETGEAYTDEQIADAQAKAQEIADELKAIEDPQERVARFLELKEEYDEDTGKTSYPNGYVFTTGEMVEEFEDAAMAAGEYEVTDPVLSTYGYHVIMRLPLDPDAVITNSGASARESAASEKFNDFFEELFASREATLCDTMNGFNLGDYLA